MYNSQHVVVFAIMGLVLDVFIVAGWRALCKQLQNYILQIFSRFSLSQQIDNILNKNRSVPKVCYTVSLATIVFLAYAIFYAQWLLLYYYTLVFPILMLIRLVMYM